MSWKGTAGVLVTVVAVTSIAIGVVDPFKSSKSPAGVGRDQQEQQFSDSDEIGRARKEQVVEGDRDALKDQRLVPGEHRPPEPFRPRFRIRF